MRLKLNFRRQCSDSYLNFGFMCSSFTERVLCEEVVSNEPNETIKVKL